MAPPLIAGSDIPVSEIIPAASPPSFAATFSLLVRREIMSNSSAPKRSIVTGAASGIGYAIAERLIADGGSVVAFDLDSGVWTTRQNSSVTTTLPNRGV